MLRGLVVYINVKMVYLRLPQSYHIIAQLRNKVSFKLWILIFYVL